LSHKE